MTTLRILLVEDQGIDAVGATQVLHEAMACEVTRAAQPAEAIARLAREHYDVVVVDMLYLALETEFQRRRREGQVRLTDEQLLPTGLAVLHAAREAGSGCAPVLWTNGEANRRLHIIFAHQQLGCRVMCPKDPASRLPEAVRAAAASQTSVDQLLRTRFPLRGAPSIAETFLSSAPKLAIWRAMALGLREHEKIAAAAGVAKKVVAKLVVEMHQALCRFDLGCDTDGKPSAELTCYATENWQFFLDDTVRRMYP